MARYIGQLDGLGRRLRFPVGAFRSWGHKSVRQRVCTIGRTPDVPFDGFLFDIHRRRLYAAYVVAPTQRSVKEADRPSTTQGRERHFSMARKTHSVHTTTHGKSSWKNTQDGKVISTHHTKAAAVDKGKTEAKKDKVEHVVHGKDGKIQSKDSYGNDPMPPRDREH